MFFTVPSITWPSSRLATISWRCSARDSSRTVRRDTTMLPRRAVHLEDLEGLRHTHQRRHVANRSNIDLAAGQERHGAVEVDREATLDLVEDDTLDLLLLLEGLFELDPALLAARLVTRDHRLTERVLDALQVDFDLVADAGQFVPTVIGKFLERDAPFGLETEVDHRDILFDGDDQALDDRSFESFVLAVALVEQSGEIIARGRA